MISTENVQKCKNQFPVVLEISSLCNCRFFYCKIRLVYMLDAISLLLLDFILVKIALPGYKYCKVKSADKKGSKISLLQMSKKFWGDDVFMVQKRVCLGHDGSEKWCRLTLLTILVDPCVSDFTELFYPINFVKTGVQVTGRSEFEDGLMAGVKLILRSGFQIACTTL